MRYQQSTQKFSIYIQGFFEGRKNFTFLLFVSKIMVGVRGCMQIHFKRRDVSYRKLRIYNMEKSILKADVTQW